MNKKNLVLISKCCLLFAFIGFCLPIFSGTNAFGYLYRYFNNKEMSVTDVKAGIRYDEASDKVVDCEIPLENESVSEQYAFAKEQLVNYDAVHDKDIPVLKDIKASVKSQVKDAKNNYKPALADAKVAKAAEIKAAKEEYKLQKPGKKVQVAQLKDLSKDIKSLNKELKSSEKASEDKKINVIKDLREGLYEVKSTINSFDFEISQRIKNDLQFMLDDLSTTTKTPGELVSIYKDSTKKLMDNVSAEASLFETKLAGIKKNGVTNARKNYAKVEKVLDDQVYEIENQYWDPYDAYNNPRKALKKQVSTLRGVNAIPALFITLMVAVFLSIIFSLFQFVISKKENYGGLSYFIDIVLLIVAAVTAVMLFKNESLLTITYVGKEFDLVMGGPKSHSVGYYFVVLGIVLSIVVYTFSITLDEKISSKSEERRAYWVLALPALLFYFAVMTFPAVFSVFLSFTNYSGGSIFARHAMDFIGFDNYVRVFEDPYFYISLKNNFWIVLVSVFGQLPLGFLLAYVLNRGLVKGRDFFQSMIYLPCVISTVVIGILFQSFFSAKGAWTDILRFFNPDYKWTMGNHPIVPVLFVILWMYTGTYLIIFLANLQKLDPGIIEAATIDGATEGQVLWHIIFPELSGTFVISAILAISGSLKSFDLIYVMTAGGPARKTSVLSLYMFDMAFKGQADYPMANTISTIMVVISLILIAIVKTLEKKFGASDDD